MVILNWLYEYWLPVRGYEGLYEVSNFGRVRSLNYNRTGNIKILAPIIVKKYLKVTLCKNGKMKRFTIHRIVAEAFIPNVKCLPEINHRDENGFNNCVWNLEWCDRQYNINYGSRTERCIEKIQKPVIQLTKDGQFVKQYSSAKIAGGITKINNKNINSVCLCKRNSAGGFIWKYLDSPEALQ